jgi:transposase-like protein
MPQNHCPKCGYIRLWKIRRNKFKCKKCRSEFSNHKYLVKHIRSTEKEWVKCIKIFLRQRTVNNISNECNISYRRAQKMAHHLRLCMANDYPDKFKGITEVDETYIGGQRKNKKLHIRRLTPPKSGHGTEKLPIIGLFNRNSGQVYVQVLKRRLKGRGSKILKVMNVIKARTHPESVIYTDTYQLYKHLEIYHSCEHESVNHYQGEYSRGGIHINNIEGFWGILKRKLGCIGGMRRKRLYLFVAEITWIFNHRNMSLSEKEQKLLKLIKDKNLVAKT